MRLDKIVLNGFKSFADKAEFSFDHNVTAVVGPNGCGKSNVVDGVKWVLGEQSVKSLRSDRMADVIFTGSSARKAAGMAEVTLCFSGTSGKLAIDQDELQIGRRLYRSGESQYLINNKSCRLRDIRELFMNTGIGLRAYSVIEQGQIEQLLHASKTDRRMIFEEAAGISKIKEHKKEALRKLERTEQNLLRIADILAEVQRQLRSIKLQAAKARNYLKYTSRLKQLRVNFSLAEYEKNTTQIEAQNVVLSRLEQQLSEAAAEVARNDALLSELSDKIIQTENEINRSDNSLVAVKSKIEQNLERIKLLQSSLQELTDRKETAAIQLQKLQEEKTRCEDDFEKANSELASSEILLEETNLAVEHLERAIHQTDLHCTALETDIEDEKSGIIDIVRRTAQLHNEIQNISVHRDNLSGQKNRLFNRTNAAKAELQQLLTEKAQHQARADDIQKLLADSQQSLGDKRKQMEELGSELTSTNERLARCKEDRSALQSELALLTDMESRGQGLSSAVKTILDARSLGDDKFDYVEAIVADVLQADVKYANAVEAALEGKTDAVIISNTLRMLKHKEVFDALQGRVAFISAESVEPFVDSLNLSRYPAVYGRLIEFVSFETKYAPLAWKLLGRTLLVDSIDQAVSYAGQLRGKYNFVTLAGELLSSDGSISIGPLGRATGLISRKSRLRELANQLESLASQICRLQDQQDKKLATNEHLTKLCRDLRTAIYEANTEKTETDSKLALIEQDIKRLTDEQPLIASQIGLLEEQIAQSVKKEYASEQKLQELEAVNTERNAHIQELEAKLAESKKQQQDQASQLTELRVESGKIAEQGKAGKQTIASLQSQLQHLQLSITSAQADADKCRQQSVQTQRDILNSEAAVSNLFVEKEKAARTSRTLHEKVKQLLEQRQETERLLREKRAKHADTEERLYQIKLELSQLEVKRTSLVQRAREELQIELSEAYAKHRREACCALAEQPKPEPLANIDWDSVRAQIAELRSKIDRLGNVNVDAIAQQEQLEQRNQFLTRQVKDLNKSKTQLQQLINRINRESREKFRTTFEQVRTNFQQIFRKLFGGGKADIFLQDPQDILESGIEIVARPPGKETRTISLLSGGEKAMTALALLFGVFKTKPSPFCLLDEVDAALDEANNERFNAIVDEFQKDSQFIIVTHAKRTMSIADELIGITMQTQGVSKKISVKFDQFDLEQSVAVA